ncbi:hypothetical protein F4781DRAFT_33665 [Annulohypoxylon bovei var. microspora]|nr:hypothetical protein F4781DRAFT_33665 [Annulohypoxylon bovei var. microspora]
MCMKATCGTCGKTTWFGCGNHIPSVLDNISSQDWCTCEPKVSVDGKEYPPKGQV